MAQQPTVIRELTAVGDPNNSTNGIPNTLKVNADGSINVDASGTTFDAGGTATAAAPTYLEGTVNPLSLNLTGDLRTISKQSGTWNIGTVTTLTGITNALPAGSNLIGKVGIDQTTPGTTNAVVIPFSRSTGYLSGTFTPGASYSSGNAVGTTITIATGLAAGTVCRVQTAAFNVVAGTIAANGGVIFTFYSATPSATITDGSTPTYTAADAAKVQSSLASAVRLNTATMAVNSVSGATLGDVTVDGSGRIFLVISGAGTTTLTTPGVATWFVNLTY